jgi:hypothetical protein
MIFESLEHEVLYDFFNTNGIADKLKIDNSITSGTSFAEAIEKINRFSVNTGDFFIYSQKHKLFGYISINFYRFIRNILRWYINPIIDRQNKYNAMVAETLKMLNKNNEELRNEIKALKKKMNIIEE